MTNYLNGLIASDFILKYVPFGCSKKEPCYKLIDPFCLFYLNFVSKQDGNENYFSENFGGHKLNAWLGRAFENLCSTTFLRLNLPLEYPG